MLSTNLVHLTIALDGLKYHPDNEPAQWSGDLALPVLASLKTLSLRQGLYYVYVKDGKNIDIPNWLLRRAPNVKALETDESFAKYVVDKCADCKFTFPPSESWCSLLLLWRIVYRLLGPQTGPPGADVQPTLMAEDRVLYWRRFSERFDGQRAPRIQWGVEGRPKNIHWFGHELPEAFWDANAPFPCVSHLYPDTELPLEQAWETLCQASQ